MEKCQDDFALWLLPFSKKKKPGNHIYISTTELFPTEFFPLWTYYEARNDYTNNSEAILLCNRCACNWKSNSQTINVCNWRVHRKTYLLSTLWRHRVTQKNSWQKALCNRCPVQLGNWFSNNQTSFLFGKESSSLEQDGVWFILPDRRK